MSIRARRSFEEHRLVEARRLAELVLDNAQVAVVGVATYLTDEERNDVAPLELARAAPI
jgi:hypothetical protein